MSSRLHTILRTLANAPRDEHLTLSIYLDRSVDSNGQPQSDQKLAQALDAIAARIDPHSPIMASFSADRDRVAQYLEGQAPAEARGLAIFACAAHQIWETIPLIIPVETAIDADPYPHTFQLASLIDNNEPLIVAVVEGQDADIYALSIEQLEHVERTVAGEEISRTQVGGWSQARYQRHTDFMIRTHLRDLADVMTQAVSRHNARHIIVAGNEAIKGQVLDVLPDNLLALLEGYVPYERVGHITELFQRMEPLMAEVEARQEQAALSYLDDQLATRGGLAAAGVSDVTQALLHGQVDSLLIRADFAGEGGECPSCGLLRAGSRESCPYDGTPLQPIELREGLVNHTLRQGGGIQICGDDQALASHEGIAALLRFRDDQPAA